MSMESFRLEVLKSLGASDAEAEELFAYGVLTFDWGSLPSLRFPWPDEAFVPFWDAYADECRRAGSLQPLSKYVVQLQFPIAEGMSQNEDYRAATRRAVDPAGLVSARGLRLWAADRCRILLHPTAGGRIPVLVAGDRRDFVSLVQAFTERNEPVPVPDSLGACMVSGYNNLHRIRLLGEQWMKENPQAAGGWSEQFGRIIAQPELYRDRLILLSEGPYSNVSALDMGQSDEQWQKLSLAIRIEHEGTHYLMRRAFPAQRFRKNMQEELVADYAGIVAACGAFRADWFLRFIGLESYPHYRQGGRLESYRRIPPLSNGAFELLQRLLRLAAANVERFDRQRRARCEPAPDTPLVLLALASLSMEELASPEGPLRIEARLREVEAPEDGRRPATTAQPV
jgi:hypothetical protein